MIVICLPNFLFSGSTAGEGTADSLSEDENNLAGKNSCQVVKYSRDLLNLKKSKNVFLNGGQGFQGSLTSLALVNISSS